MKPPQRTGRLQLLLWLILLISIPARAQHRPSSPSPKPPARAEQTAARKQTAPTFDTILAAGSYKVYGEVRGFGQLIHSGGVADIINPIMRLAGPPKEFKTLVRWANAHADALTTSRMLVAAWPAKPKLPQVLIAVEFPSAEEAQKFEPQLRDFLLTLLPTPTPAPKTSPAQNNMPPATANQKVKEQPTALPFFIKQSGDLVLISDQPFNFDALRPKDSKLLTEEQGFQIAHARFASDPIFIYFNASLEDKTVVKPPGDTAAAPLPEAESAQPESVEDLTQKSDEALNDSSVTEMTANPASGEPPSPPVQAEAAATPGSSNTPASPAPPTGVLTAQGTSPPALVQTVETPDATLYPLFSSFFGGATRYPEGVGAAVDFEPDGYVIRTLLINGPDSTPLAIPFVPELISGPALVPESPSVMPSDTELFITASLDLPQIYDGMIKRVKDLNRTLQRRASQSTGNLQPESPFAVYEKKLGLKVKEDILPALGNEIAVSIPMKSLIGTPSSSSRAQGEKSERNSGQTAGTNPVVLLSLRDKEAVRALVPRVIEALGYKEADLIAQTEKRDDTEIVSYANAVAYGFIGNFLVLSTDKATIRHVVDSYLSHQTLGSDIRFKNSTRWQPRQVLGQVYLSPALMESYNYLTKDLTGAVSEKTKEFLARLSPVVEPLTYSLSNEGSGPLHELHIPKNLVLIMIAGISGEVNQSPLATNEALARSAVASVAIAEMSYQATRGEGRYATLDQLLAEGLVQKELMQNYGYRIDVTVSGARFDVSAVPVQYGQTGRMSFFVDETSVVRSGDHGGSPASANDSPVR